MKLRHRVIPIIQRVFGAALLFFGLNKMFAFVPLPERIGFAKLFLDAIGDAGYIMPIIMIAQIMVGLALLTNRFVALGLVIIFPISLNIFLFHLLNDAEGIVPATIFMAWNTVLLFANMPKYKPMLLAR